MKHAKKIHRKFYLAWEILKRKENTRGPTLDEIMNEAIARAAKRLSKQIDIEVYETIKKTKNTN